MEVIENISYGFSVLFVPARLFFCFLGVLVGTLVGVLPGLGPAGAVALLLPATFSLDPTTALVMLAGIYYGAMYGGSTTSILVNIPGEAASVVTCLDGFRMAQQGRAGPALGIAAFGSFIAGTFSVLGLMTLAPLLTRVALAFGPPEYFALLFAGLSILIYLASGPILKAIIMAVVGIFLGTIGLDIMTGLPRFNFGSLTLIDGVGVVPLIIGLFGIAEILESLEQELIKQTIVKGKISHLLPNLKDWRASIGPIIRGWCIGFFLGILPGGSATVSSFTSYALEKKISKHPDQFGKGAIEGVAGPEAANNAAATSSFIPLLSLGIPTNIVMALVLGGLIIFGIQPGPLFFVEYPDMFWGVVTSMYVGNAMLLVLNLPLIGLWVMVLRVPVSILYPLIIMFCLMGSYSVNSNVYELIIMIIFGVFGYLMRKFRYEAAPLIFGFILSSLIENKFRQSLLMSSGSFLIFFTRPIALVFMLVGITLFFIPVLRILKSRSKNH
jgi:putative tricarboxylic transport membrane protein